MQWSVFWPSEFVECPVNCPFNNIPSNDTGCLIQWNGFISCIMIHNKPGKLTTTKQQQQQPPMNITNQQLGSFNGSSTHPRWKYMKIIQVSANIHPPSVTGTYTGIIWPWEKSNHHEYFKNHVQHPCEDQRSRSFFFHQNAVRPFRVTQLPQSNDIPVRSRREVPGRSSRSSILWYCYGISIKHSQNNWNILKPWSASRIITRQYLKNITTTIYPWYSHNSQSSTHDIPAIFPLHSDGIPIKGPTHCWLPLCFMFNSHIPCWTRYIREGIVQH